MRPLTWKPRLKHKLPREEPHNLTQSKFSRRQEVPCVVSEGAQEGLQGASEPEEECGGLHCGPRCSDGRSWKEASDTCSMSGNADVLVDIQRFGIFLACQKAVWKPVWSISVFQRILVPNMVQRLGARSLNIRALQALDLTPTHFLGASHRARIGAKNYYIRCRSLGPGDVSSGPDQWRGER